MRTFVILLIIVLIIALAYYEVMKIWNNITFDFNFNLAAIDLTSLATKSTITIPIIATITNDNGFSFDITNLKAWLYYENTLIAQTSEEAATFVHTVPAHGNIPVIDPNVSLFINPASINLIKNYFNHPNVNFTVQMKVLGIPFSYSDSFSV